MKESLEWIKAFHKLDRYAQTIIITDGQPNDHEGTYKMVQELRRMGMRVSMILYIKRKRKSYWSICDLMQRTGDLRVISELRDLPNAFFDLVRPLEDG